MMTAVRPLPLFTITCSSETVRDVEAGPKIMEICDRMFRQYGVRPTVTAQATVAVVSPAVPTAPPTQVVLLPAPAAETISPEGKARSERDASVLSANGFSVAKPLFERGTVVNEIGVENARKARAEYEAMPRTADACEELLLTVRAEKRQDTAARLSDLTMLADGRMTRGGGTLQVTERAFQQLAGRLSSCLSGQGGPSLGGAGSYLRACPPALRAQNVNHWLDESRKLISASPESADENVTLRHRRSQTGREIYSVVSPSYSAYDADQIAEAVGRAVPNGARGGVTYDGYRTRIEALFHTTVQPQHFVAGEFFRAGVVVRTDDTGGGSITVQAVVWQNLCLNLIVIDRSSQETCRIRHVGSVSRLADEFRKGFDAALGKIHHFVEAWDTACDDVITAPSGFAKYKDGAELRKALMEAAITSVVQRDLVPVVGRKADAVPVLRRLWESDDSGAGRAHDGLNRAGLVNAFTRYAHTVAAQTGPWIEDEIQESAGRLLQSNTRLI